MNYSQSLNIRDGLNRYTAPEPKNSNRGGRELEVGRRGHHSQVKFAN